MIHKSLKDAEIFTGPTSKTYEYNIADKDINFCIVDIDGRSPVQGMAVNRVCKEMAHVISGGGI